MPLRNSVPTLKKIVKSLAAEPVMFNDGTQATVSGRTRREVQRHMADRRVIAVLAKIRKLAARGVYLYSAENGRGRGREARRELRDLFLQSTLQNTA